MKDIGKGVSTTKVQIWSDFMCPFCYIGETTLQLAIQNLGLQKEVKVELKSYELDPGQKEWFGGTFIELIMDKYGMPLSKAKSNNEHITAHAKKVGLDFHMDIMKPTNSFKAHCLEKLASSQGKEMEMAHALFQAYFTDGKNLSDEEFLIQKGEEIGLSRDDIQQAIEPESSFAQSVRNDERQAQDYGIIPVPFIVINGKYAIQGAQSQATFEKALNRAWKEERPANHFEDVSGNHSSGQCSDGSCSI